MYDQSANADRCPHALRSLDADGALGILPSPTNPLTRIGARATPASGVRVTRSLAVFGGAQSGIRRRSALSAETVGGHAQKKGVVEDYWLLIKTPETETLNTTGFEHAYRRLRMRSVFTCATVRQGMTG